MPDWNGGLKVTITDADGEVFAQHEFGPDEAGYLLAGFVDEEQQRALGLKYVGEVGWSPDKAGVLEGLKQLNMVDTGEVSVDDFFNDLYTACNNVIRANGPVK